MSYKYLEHTADVGIECSGNSLEEAFSEGAKALFNVMVDLSQVEALELITFDVEAESIESLFVEFLNHLIALKDINDAVYSEFNVQIKKEGNLYHLDCVAKGEILDQQKHKIRTEVKSATYYGLKYDPEKKTLTVVLDV